MRDNTVNLRQEEEMRQPHGFPEVPFPGSGDLHRRHGTRRRRLVAAAWLVAIVAVVGCVWSALAAGMAWRAVFLANNQVYFGHFWDVPFASTITLRDVYYLQVAQPNQQLSGQDQSSLKLVKLGNEIHGPTNEMVIPLSQVLFYETLRSNSAIVQTITNGNLSANK